MRWLYRMEEAVCVVLILSATFVLFGNVVARYFGKGTTWSDEFIRYSFIWITFIGGAICIRKGIHYSVDLLDSFLKEKGKKILLLITSIITLLFLLWMLVLGIETVLFNYKNGQVSPGLGIPIYFVYLSIPIGFFLMVLHNLNLLIQLIRR